MDTRDELLALFLGTAASVKTYEDQLRRTARELQSVLGFLMEFANIYCEM